MDEKIKVFNHKIAKLTSYGCYLDCEFITAKFPDENIHIVGDVAEYVYDLERENEQLTNELNRLKSKSKITRFKSNWYSIEDIRWNGKQHRYVQDPNGYLYSNAKYNTKIKAEDLPEWYIYGRFYKRYGYVSAKGVVDLYYKPNNIFNHFLRDDYLYISYKNKIDQRATDVLKLYWRDGVLSVNGGDIITMLKAIRKYSNYDISPIIQQIKDKLQWFKHNFPEDYENRYSKLNLDNVFND